MLCCLQNSTTLFKYSKVKNVISLLSDDLMYLPKIEDLNDPFECNIFYDFDIVLAKFIDNLDKFIDYSEFIDENITEDESVFISEFIKQPIKEPFKKVLSDLEDKIKNKTSIICLTEDYCINPMWAHYADNHKGVCIEYDFENISLLKYGKENYIKHKNDIYIFSKITNQEETIEIYNITMNIDGIYKIILKLYYSKILKIY